ncbi:MAG: histidinol-phosphate transaminase [Bacteroidota bacterium]
MSGFKGIDNLIRENIRNLKPYSSARDEYKGTGGILLDANENPIGSTVDGAYNRYPDPRQRNLKQKFAKLNKVLPANIFIGNGSDEAIDLLFRAFCNPGKDKAVILPPTYGMYKVSASINDVETIEVQLTASFQPDVENILAKANTKTKLLFLCSPNNPTGNAFAEERMQTLLNNFPGIVVVDEAYIDFSEKPSMLRWLDHYPNLVVLQTMSKAWGLAGLRLGLAYANASIIEILNKIKPPYNINSITQKLGLEALGQIDLKKRMVTEILREKSKLEDQIRQFSFVQKVFPSDTNYLLVKLDDPLGLYEFLIKENIVVRDRSRVVLCEGCLRFTVGNPDENEQLITSMNRYPST